MPDSERFTVKSVHEARKILCSSPIFENCWQQKIGGGKGYSFFEMYQDIADELPVVKSMLNVGVGPGAGMKNETIRWLKVYDKMFGPIERFVNIDIEPGAIEAIENKIKKKKIEGRAVDYVSECYVCDVRKIDELNQGTFDLLLWSHGPEHIYREEWAETFAKLDKIAKVIVIHLPWGSGYNDEPTHFSPSVRRGELEQFGFKIRYVGVEDTKQACMYGWKRGIA